MSWFAPLVLGYARAAHAAMRLQEAVHAAVEGCLCHALNAEEKSAVTIGIFDARAQREPEPRALFAWEEAWFEAHLPDPPASVLLGGAGSGAEASWLSAAGYTVHAFEPAAACLAQLTAAVAPRGSAHRASFAELVRAPARLSALLAPHYRAAIVGWGALSHVLDHPQQLQLLAALVRLCPDGPILFSCQLHPEGEPERKSRAHALGAALGERIARARRLPAPAARERFLGHAGFVHIFSRRELEQLARELDRVLSLHPDPYPHASLWPHGMQA